MFIRDSAYANGTVTGSQSAVGGFAGFNTGVLESPISRGAVNGYYSVGGLVGYNQGTINSGNSTGVVFNSVNGNGNALGGFVGLNTGTINNSTSSGNVYITNAYNIGGFVGRNESTITNSRACLLYTSDAADELRGV